MNTYEQMFLDDVRKLKGIIGDLLEEQIDNNDKEPEELKEIRKVIDFRFYISLRCSFETETPVISGRKNFTSIDEYYNREDYSEYTNEVDWEEDFDCGYFNWSETPEIRIDRVCLSQNASDEAKSLLKSLENTSTTLHLQKQMVLLQQRIERARLAE